MLTNTISDFSLTCLSTFCFCLTFFACCFYILAVFNNLNIRQIQQKWSSHALYIPGWLFGYQLSGMRPFRSCHNFCHGKFCNNTDEWWLIFDVRVVSSVGTFFFNILDGDLTWVHDLLCPTSWTTPTNPLFLCYLFTSWIALVLTWVQNTAFITMSQSLSILSTLGCPGGGSRLTTRSTTRADFQTSRENPASWFSRVFTFFSIGCFDEI